MDFYISQLPFWWFVTTIFIACEEHRNPVFIFCMTMAEVSSGSKAFARL
jgi:hypothetical protein